MKYTYFIHLVGWYVALCGPPVSPMKNSGLLEHLSCPSLMSGVQLVRKLRTQTWIVSGLNINAAKNIAVDSKISNFKTPDVVLGEIITRNHVPSLFDAWLKGWMHVERGGWKSHNCLTPEKRGRQKRKRAIRIPGRTRDVTDRCEAAWWHRRVRFGKDGGGEVLLTGS